jgi:LysM repeat protein
VADEPFQPQFPDAHTLPDADATPAPPAPPAPAPPPDDDLEPEPQRPLDARRRSAADAALPWVLAVVVVLLLAASGGLVSAWAVANLRAVPAPALADMTPSPNPTTSSGASAEPTQVASEQPRHTPEPSPVMTQEPAPFIHVVRRGEYLSYIADLYGVTVEEIVALNDIKNPNRIRPGQELLIPGYGHQPSPSPGPG